MVTSGFEPHHPDQSHAVYKLNTIYFMNRDNLALIFLAIDVALIATMFVIYKTCF